MRISVLWLCTAVAIGICMPSERVHAQEPGVFSCGDRGHEPMRVTAETSWTNTLPGGEESVFKGKVEVRQGNFSMDCDELSMVVELNPSGEPLSWEEVILPAAMTASPELKRIVATGHVKIMQDDTTAFASTAVIDNEQGLITIKGNPARLILDNKESTADAMIIYMDENRVDLLRRTAGAKEPPFGGSLW